MTAKRFIAIVTGVLLLGLLVGCGADPTPTATAPPPEPTPTMAAAMPAPEPEPAAMSLADKVAELECDREVVGTIVRCNNFFSDYWPVVEQALQQLYEEAMTEESGEVINWGFSPPNQAQQGAFAEAYPGMKVVGQGFQFGTSAAIITAQKAGKVESDLTGGSALIWRPAYKEGAIDTTIDWSALGIPTEFLDPKNPGMVFNNMGGHVQWYNASALDEADVPTNAFDYLNEDWENRVASSIRFFPLGMAYTAIKFGEERTDELATRLIDDKIVTLVENPGALVVAGEYDVAWPSTERALYNETLAKFTGVLGWEGGGTWPGHSGIIKGAKNPKGAMLYAVWQNFDPEWISTQFSDPNLPPSRPYLGIPTWPDRHIGLQAILSKLDQDWYTVEDSDIVDEVNRLTSKYRTMITGG